LPRQQRRDLAMKDKKLERVVSPLQFLFFGKEILQMCVALSGANLIRGLLTKIGSPILPIGEDDSNVPRSESIGGNDRDGVTLFREFGIFFDTVLVDIGLHLIFDDGFDFYYSGSHYGCSLDTNLFTTLFGNRKGTGHAFIPNPLEGDGTSRVPFVNLSITHLTKICNNFRCQFPAIPQYSSNLVTPISFFAMHRS